MMIGIALVTLIKIICISSKVYYGHKKNEASLKDWKAKWTLSNIMVAEL